MTLLAIAAVLWGSQVIAQEYSLIRTKVVVVNKANVVMYDTYHRYDDRWRIRMLGKTARYSDAETLARGVAAREAGEHGFSHVVIENLKENERPGWCKDADPDPACRGFNITLYYTFTNEAESGEGEVLATGDMLKPMRLVRGRNRIAMVDTNACYDRTVRVGAFDDIRGPDCKRHVFDTKTLGDMPAPERE